MSEVRDWEFFVGEIINQIASSRGVDTLFGVRQYALGHRDSELRVL
jgi:hypothetical protein